MASKYSQIADQLRTYIREYNTKSVKLPTEEELCEKYNVSRQTVRKALSVLYEENLIIKKQGSGTYSKIKESAPVKKNVALLICSNTEYIYPSFISNLKARLQVQGYNLLLRITDNKIEREREILSELLNESLAGIIVEPCYSSLPTPNDDLFKSLGTKGVKILFIYGKYPNLNDYAFINPNEYSASYELCNHLISKGHTKIACLFRHDSYSGVQKYHGYAACLRDNGIKLNFSNILWCDFSQINMLQKKQDTDFLSEFIKRNLRSCSAVICHSDELAYWLTKELKKYNLNVPDDISIVCFNNTYLNEISDVPATTMAYRKNELSNLAASQILTMINGHGISHSNISLKLISAHSVKSLQ